MGAAPLPVTAEFIDRRLVRGPGPWADTLGQDEKGFCEITRNITVNGNFRCLSRLYARVGRFPKIMKLPQTKMSGNLKRVLAEEFDAPTLSLDQFILPGIFDDKVCAALEIDSGSTGMIVNAVGYSIGKEAITFQSLWVPNGGYFLEVSQSGQRRRRARPERRSALRSNRRRVFLHARLSQAGSAHALLWVLNRTFFRPARSHQKSSSAEKSWRDRASSAPG